MDWPLRDILVILYNWRSHQNWIRCKWATITTRKDNTEYLYLDQLVDILGLSRQEIVEVHRSQAEQTFRQEVEVIWADGQLTKAKLEQLNEGQKKVGLRPEYAQKVRESIINSKMAATIKHRLGRVG